MDAEPSINPTSDSLTSSSSSSPSIPVPADIVDTEMGSSASKSISAVREIAVRGVPKYAPHYKVLKDFQAMGVPAVHVSKQKDAPMVFVGFANQADKDKAVEILSAAVDEKGKKTYKLSEIIATSNRQIKEKEMRERTILKKLANPRAFDEEAYEKKKEQRHENSRSGKRKGGNNAESSEAASATESKEADGSEEKIDADGENGAGGEQKKRRRMERTDEKDRNIQDQVTPLWKLTYEEQLAQKEKETAQLLKKTARQLRKDFPDHEWAAGEKGALCPLEPIVPSPELNGYRNKNEFTIGPGVDRKPTVGFLLGLYSEGFMAVMPPNECKHIPQQDIKLAEIFTEYIRSTGFDAYDKHTHVGVWRRLTVRSSWATKELMVMVQIDPRTLSAEQVEQMRKDILNLFVSRVNESKEWKEQFGSIITNIIFQQYSGVSNAAPEDCPLEILLGPGFIVEHILGLQFRLSLNAFFQVNTKGAERLYSIATEWAGCGPNTVLLDVCCGTGTIGLTLARKVKRVIGFELVEAAIEDAKGNATRNGIENASYVCGKAEVTLPPALDALDETDDVVAIVDPPRMGLHGDTVRALRNCKRIRRIVYVSCNPTTLGENVRFLMRPTNRYYKNAPFKAVKAVAVDMFPHTDHCEMVMLLERSAESAGAASSNPIPNPNSSAVEV